MTRPRHDKSWLRSVAEFVGIVLAVLIAKTAIAEPFYVPSGSMEPTLLIGDALLASKFPYGYSAASLPFGVTTLGNERVLGALPQRGDVVVFRWPGKAQTWGVKRVIGLPGDRIAMQAGQLRINGQTAALVADGIGAAESEDGTQIAARRLVETLPGGRQHLIYRLDRSWSPGDFPELMVPAGHLFLLGDNRDNSLDSRFPVQAGGVGLLPVGNLVGRVDALVGSWDSAMKPEPVWSWPAGLRLSRFFTAVR